MSLSLYTDSEDSSRFTSVFIILLPLVGAVFILTVMLVFAAIIIVLCKRRKRRVVVNRSHEIVEHIYDVPGAIVKSKSQREHQPELRQDERAIDGSAQGSLYQMNMKSNVAYGCIGPGRQRPTDILPSEAQYSEVSML